MTQLVNRVIKTSHILCVLRGGGGGGDHISFDLDSVYIDVKRQNNICCISMA